MKGIQLVKLQRPVTLITSTRYQVDTIILPREQQDEEKTNYDCFSCDSVRAGYGSPGTVFLPLFMAASSPRPDPPAPLHVLSLPLPFSRFLFSAILKNKMLLALAVLI